MRKILALFAATVVALTMTVAISAPAHAAGWSGRRCDNQASDYAAKICVDVHTIPSGNGLRVDQVEVCAYKVSQSYYNGLRGTKQNAIYFRGSGGAWLSGDVLLNTGSSAGGTCSYTNVSEQMGNGACYLAGGAMDLAQYPDRNWGVSGGVTGGAWDCP